MFMLTSSCIFNGILSSQGQSLSFTRNNIFVHWVTCNGDSVMERRIYARSIRNRQFQASDSTPGKTCTCLSNIGTDALVEASEDEPLPTAVLNVHAVEGQVDEYLNTHVKVSCPNRRWCAKLPVPYLTPDAATQEWLTAKVGYIGSRHLAMGAKPWLSWTRLSLCGASFMVLDEALIDAAEALDPLHPPFFLPLCNATKLATAQLDPTHTHLPKHGVLCGLGLGSGIAMDATSAALALLDQLLECTFPAGAAGQWHSYLRCLTGILRSGGMLHRLSVFCGCVQEGNEG
eukprot:1144295-Pelagomonas_calceolata.AAC.1